MKQLIGFSGKIGTGKTTVCKIIIGKCIADHQIPIPHRMAFGDALKEEAARIYFFPLEWAYHNKDAKVSICPAFVPHQLIDPEWDDAPTVREILQFYATDIVRRKDPDHWVRVLDERIRAMDNARQVVLVDDVRFPNELEYVKRHGVCYRLEPYEGWNHASGHEGENILDSAAFDGIFRPQFGFFHLREVARSVYEAHWGKE